MVGDGFSAALQLSDSALPAGRFAHSAGVEAFLTSNPDAGEKEIVELVETVIHEAAAPLDAVALVAAHRAVSLGDLVALDRLVTGRKLGDGARNASAMCGRQLAALVPVFCSEGLAAAFSARVRAAETDGNLAVVEGALAASVGIPVQEAVLISLRSTAASLLSVAVRMGRLPALRAQSMQRALGPLLLEATSEALDAQPSQMRSTTPELEIHSLAHARATARMFIT